MQNGLSPNAASPIATSAQSSSVLTVSAHAGTGSTEAGKNLAGSSTEKTTTHERDGPSQPQPGDAHMEDSQKPELHKVTCVDLATLPISLDQIREAVYLLEKVIQQELGLATQPTDLSTSI